MITDDYGGDGGEGVLAKILQMISREGREGVFVINYSTRELIMTNHIIENHCCFKKPTLF